MSSVEITVNHIRVVRFFTVNTVRIADNSIRKKSMIKIQLNKSMKEEIVMKKFLLMVGGIVLGMAVIYFVKS
ncbi:hypothetical protein BHL54_12350 [Bacillus cereus]|nr:hypothetical protein BHL54_12350 [Bacillus cereus]